MTAAHRIFLVTGMLETGAGRGAEDRVRPGHARGRKGMDRHGNSAFWILPHFLA